MNLSRRDGRAVLRLFGERWDQSSVALIATRTVPGAGSIDLSEAPDRFPLLLETMSRKRMPMQNFIIFNDNCHRYDEFARDMS